MDDKNIINHVEEMLYKMQNSGVGMIKIDNTNILDPATSLFIRLQKEVSLPNFVLFLFFCISII